MSTAWLATFRRDRRGLSSAAAFSKRGLKFSSLMRVGGTLWDGQAHCTQSTLQHGQAAFAAAARVQAQPMPARSATGCEPAVHNQQARHMRLFCSSSSSKGGKSSRSSPQPPSQADLITIKGVGPVNKALLISKGVDSVNRLHELYHTEANAKDEEMVKFLRGQVGIKFQHHCQAITQHIKAISQTVASLQPGSDRVTLCVEGNISAGKSTFLDLIKNTLNSDKTDQAWPQVSVVPEPVDTWQNIKGGGNILDAFYKQPERYAYTFQNYVFLTRCMQEREEKTADLRLLERSVFSDRMVFVQAVHESKYMSDLELSVYNSWFDPMVNEVLPDIVPDGFIYLRALPETCNARMALRNRSEETGIRMDYLEKLHEKHERWLGTDCRPWASNNNQRYAYEPINNGAQLLNSHGLPFSNQTPDILCSPAALPKEPPPDSIRDLVVRLTKSHTCDLHTSILDTPALVLDCGNEHDLRTDTAAREDLAGKVQTYFQWVKKSKKAAASHYRHQDFANELSGVVPLAAADRRILDQARARHMMWGERCEPSSIVLPSGSRSLAHPDLFHADSRQFAAAM